MNRSFVLSTIAGLAVILSACGSSPDATVTPAPDTTVTPVPAAPPTITPSPSPTTSP